MRHWENNTCLSFVPRQTNHKDYIIFTYDKCGCCSYVGRKGDGPQAISIGKNCDKFGIVVHELGHVVGFWHEHTRHDRDDHVEIFHNSIQPAQDYNFDKLKLEEVNSLGEPYDYASIMHYARDTFSRAMYMDTIMPRGRFHKLPEIGQRMQLSPGDISQTKKLYGCPECGGTHINEYGVLKIKHSTICQWKIIASSGEILVLNISTTAWPEPTASCSTERDNFLIIRDGYFTGSPIIGKVCGGTSSRSFISSGNRLFVQAHLSKPIDSILGYYVAVCGGQIVSERGIVQSPRFPENYAPDTDCTWLITFPVGYQVAIIIHYLNLEAHGNCIYDYLEIYDGTPTASSKPISKLCGEINNAHPFVSTSNAVALRFKSDSSVQKCGFHVEFRQEKNECLESTNECEQLCINKIGGYKCECYIGFALQKDRKKCQRTCGGLFKAPKGTLKSPNYPRNYPPSETCIWQIRAEDSEQVILNFTHFNVEGMKTECAYDYVQITDEDSGKSERYCGEYEHPLMYTSNSNLINIQFVSDDSIEKSGFRAFFVTDLDECRINNGNCQQICVNAIGSYSCECKEGYILASDRHNCIVGSCHFELQYPEGEFTTPNYPFDYPQSKTCSWHFVTTPGHRLSLIFEEFVFEEHLNCKYDNTKIFDGGDTSATSLGVFCGTYIPPLIQSSSNQLFVSISTDASVARRGFRAFYSSVCGGLLVAESSVGYIYSHARYSDAKYDRRMRCEWKVGAEDGRSVELKFVQFDLEKGKHCEFDYVEIYNGKELTENYRVIRFCGNKLPPLVVSTGQWLTLVLNTDESEEKKGFVAEYRTISPATAMPVLKYTHLNQS